MQTLVNRSFDKDVRRASDRNAHVALREVIRSVERAQSLREIPNLRKIRGERDYYRIRLGDYRIGIALQKNVVTFVRFLHRKDIYKYFP